MLRDTDFIVRVSDVYPDGRSMLLVDYVRRARYREGFERRLLLTPGAVHDVTFDVGWLSQAFAKGHRIRATWRAPGRLVYEAEPEHRRAADDRAPGLRVETATNRVHHSLSRLNRRPGRQAAVGRNKRSAVPAEAMDSGGWPIDPRRQNHDGAKSWTRFVQDRAVFDLLPFCPQMISPSCLSAAGRSKASSLLSGRLVEVEPEAGEGTFAVDRRRWSRPAGAATPRTVCGPLRTTSGSRDKRRRHGPQLHDVEQVEAFPARRARTAWRADRRRRRPPARVTSSQSFDFVVDHGPIHPSAGRQRGHSRNGGVQVAKVVRRDMFPRRDRTARVRSAV